MRKEAVLLIKCIAAAVISILVGGSFNFLIDPLQFYRKADVFKPNLYAQERYQNPGIAKSMDYDTVIIGTSMMQNFSPKYIAEKLALNAVKLSISGSTVAEQNMILQVAIRTGKVKNVIWGIDYSSINTKPNEVRDEDVKFPYYMYNTSVLDDYKYLFNSNTTELSIKAILNRMSGKKINEKDMLEKYTNWAAYSVFGKKYALEAYDKLMKEAGESAKKTNRDYENIRWNMDNQILKIIKENSDIHFYMFYTPNSVLANRYYYALGEDVFNNFLESRRYLVDSCDSLGNVSFYEFQSDSAIVTNLDNYKDQSHYSEAVNRYIIDSIAGSGNVVNAGNIDEMNKILRDLVINMKIVP